MSFHIRKLIINDSFQDSISRICQPYCVDRTLNKDGSCPILCMAQCYQTCYHPLIPDLPPPPLPPPSVSYHHLSKSFGLSIFLIVCLALLATTFFVFFTYTVYKFIRKQRQPPAPRQQEEEDDDDGEARLDFLDEDHGPVVDHPIWYIRTAGLQPSVISAITICKYKRGDGLVEGTECSVCLNEFQEDETLRLLPKCNHAFHIPCIDTWLRSHTNCPLCRAGIVINSASSQSTWQSNNSDSDSVGGENQVSVSGNIRVSSSRDMENDEVARRVTIEVEDEQELRAQNISKREEDDAAGNSCAIASRDGIQPVRRSVSLDSLSASIMSSAITDAFAVNSGRSSDKQDLEMNGTTSNTTAMAMKRVDTNQSLSKPSAGSSSSSSSSMVMRSLSCSAKVFLSRYSRSTRISVVPLPRSF